MKNNDKKRSVSSSGRPSTSIEGREAQLTALAVNLAEQKLLDGTASSQIIAYFLKKSSPREELELERLREENNLLKAKVKALESAERSDEAYRKALEAFTEYKGSSI